MTPARLGGVPDFTPVPRVERVQETAASPTVIP